MKVLHMLTIFFKKITDFCQNINTGLLRLARLKLEMINEIMKRGEKEETTMRIQQMIRKSFFIVSCVVLVSLAYKNTAYAKSQTKVQLYVQDDTQSDTQNNVTDNKVTNTTAVQTGDEAGGKVLDYQILIAISIILGIAVVIMGKSNNKEKSGE